MSRRTRRRRGKRGGSRGGSRVTFTNNTKSPVNNNYTHVSNTHFNELAALVHSRTVPVSEYHADDAEILATVQNSYNDPADMKAALQLVYDPQPLTENEQRLLDMLRTRRHAINRIAIAPMPAEQRHRLLNHVRYQQALRKIAHIYETAHKPHPKYVHAEWNRT